jgi:23S rRNA pseudouridine1911/1915/1917 synthase
VNALLHYTRKLSNYNAADRPGIVHRIDKDTSGLLVIAKDEWTHAKLAEQFTKHTIEREYRAICWKPFKKLKGEISTLITRSKKDRKIFTTSETEGKQAITFYEVLENFEFSAMVKLNLKTGRTHQIRVHLSSIGHPIFGDAIYGGTQLVVGAILPKMKSRLDNLLKIMTRQALHAKTLGFYHPHRKEFMKFDSELPDDMKLLIEKLQL